MLGLNSAAPGRDKMDAVEELVLVIDVIINSVKTSSLKTISDSDVHLMDLTGEPIEVIYTENSIEVQTSPRIDINSDDDHGFWTRIMNNFVDCVGGFEVIILHSMGNIE